MYHDTDVYATIIMIINCIWKKFKQNIDSVYSGMEIEDRPTDNLKRIENTKYKDARASSLHLHILNRT
jgi:hypothetical protein